MFITPSFKKSLIVEQFQGNYLKFRAYFDSFLSGMYLLGRDCMLVPIPNICDRYTLFMTPLMARVIFFLMCSQINHVALPELSTHFNVNCFTYSGLLIKTDRVKCAFQVEYYACVPEMSRAP